MSGSKYVPTHRRDPEPRAGLLASPRAQTAKAALRSAGLMSGATVAATGLAVGACALSASSSPSEVSGATATLASAGSTSPAAATASDRAALADRERSAQTTSRSSGDRRDQADQLKTRTLSNASGKAVTKSADLRDADPRTLARALMPSYGMSSSQFSCLDNIWSQESGWNTHADNPSSSAYGIPQALPGSKMASAGPNWEDNPETQIRWGLGYVHDRYGSACSAWSFKQGHGWY